MASRYRSTLFSVKMVGASGMRNLLIPLKKKASANRSEVTCKSRASRFLFKNRSKILQKAITCVIILCNDIREVCWLLGTSVPKQAFRSWLSRSLLLVLATWYICSEKAIVRAIERIFTGCRSMGCVAKILSSSLL